MHKSAACAVASLFKTNGKNHKFCKASALNTRLFKLLCEDLGSEHTSLFYHTEIRWLSHGNATKCLFEMKNEMLLLFKELGHEYFKDLEYDKFV